MATPYTEDEKSTGLDALVTLDAGDLFIVGDISDSGFAKAITKTDMQATTGITQLQTDVTNIQGDITTLQGDVINLQNQIDSIQVGDGGGFSAKAKSYSLEGLLGSPLKNGFQSIETYLTIDGTTVYVEFPQEFIQSRDYTLDWADADECTSYVVQDGFLYLLLRDNAGPEYRVYRYLMTDIAAGGTVLTVAVQTLGTQSGMMMTADGTDFYFNYLAGNSANDFDVSQYTIAATTITHVGDIACGAIANALDVFAVFSNGDIYGLNLTGTRQFKKFDTGGTLQDTFGPYDADYNNLINWDETIYIVKTSGDDEAFRVSLEDDDLSGAGNIKKVGVGNSSNLNWINFQLPFSFDTATNNVQGDWWAGSAAAGMPSMLILGAGNSAQINNSLLDGLFGNYVGPGVLNFNGVEQLIAEGVVRTGPGGADDRGSWGFADATAPTALFNAAGTNALGVCFSRTLAGQWVAHVGTGAAFTDVNLTIADGKHVFRIEYQPNHSIPQARFYIDRVLVATITTNLPTAIATGVSFAMGNSGDNSFESISCPTFAQYIL